MLALRLVRTLRPHALNDILFECARPALAPVPRLRFVFEPTMLMVNATLGLGPDDALLLAFDGLNDIDSCAAARLVHCDIKRGNVGRDFRSLVWHLRDLDSMIDVAHACRHTTPKYRAPEMRSGLTKATPQMAVFSLGLVVRELLNKYPNEHAARIADVMTQWDPELRPAPQIGSSSSSESSGLYLARDLIRCECLGAGHGCGACECVY